MKKKFIATYDYGAAATGCFIWAHGIAEISTKYPGFTGIELVNPRNWPTEKCTHIPEIHLDNPPKDDKFLIEMEKPCGVSWYVLEEDES